MAIYLKSLGALVAVFGILMGFEFTRRVVGDEAFERAAQVRERNPGNVLFESEYRMAEAGHVFLVYSAASCFLTAAIGGSVLWGVGALHTKLDRKRLASPPAP